MRRHRRSEIGLAPRALGRTPVRGRYPADPQAGVGRGLAEPCRMAGCGGVLLPSARIDGVGWPAWARVVPCGAGTARIGDQLAAAPARTPTRGRPSAVRCIGGLVGPEQGQP
jgi:hypothetical protein